VRAFRLVARRLLVSRHGFTAVAGFLLVRFVSKRLLYCVYPVDDLRIGTEESDYVSVDLRHLGVRIEKHCGSDASRHLGLCSGVHCYHIGVSAWEFRNRYDAQASPLAELIGRHCWFIHFGCRRLLVLFFEIRFDPSLQEHLPMNEPIRMAAMYGAIALIRLVLSITGHRSPGRYRD
jgi:hypothetical protein